MQVVRTILWVLLVVALALFSLANWVPASVQIWPGILIDTMLPALVILAFALGFVPMWLVHRAAQWQARRRIAALEQAARPVAVTPPPAPPPPVTAPPSAVPPASPAPPPPPPSPLDPVA